MLFLCHTVVHQQCWLFIKHVLRTPVYEVLCQNSWHACPQRAYREYTLWAHSGRDLTPGEPYSQKDRGLGYREESNMCRELEVPLSMMSSQILFCWVVGERS